MSFHENASICAIVLLVGTQTPGLGPYTTDRDIPTLGAGGETAGIWA